MNLDVRVLVCGGGSLENLKWEVRTGPRTKTVPSEPTRALGGDGGTFEDPGIQN